ncbi:MAG: hypothetical protein O3B73_09035, partial [bacterium]|nr:hypothetical protein [bacterium]
MALMGSLARWRDLMRNPGNRNMEKQKSARALILGLAFVVFVSLVGPYALWVMRSSALASGYLPLGVIFPFFLLVLMNGLLIRYFPRRALAQQEMILILIMALVGAAIPTWGVTGYLLSVTAAPFYYATSENRWADVLLPHIPPWLVVTDQAALNGFFNGLPDGGVIPWGVWAEPLFWWVGLIAAIFAASYALMVMLRKQWVERERLSYPLAQVPLDLTQGSQASGGFPIVMRVPIFWMGFFLAFLILMWNAIHYFHPTVPEIPIASQWIPVARGFPDINAMISFPVIGFTFLIQADVSFSIWFFHLVSNLQIGFFNRIGFTIGSGDIYGSAMASQGWMGFGAMVFMVLWGLWMARNHLSDVVRKAVRGDREVDDSGEMMSYRSAALTLLLSITYLVFWLVMSGMDAWVVLPFLFAVFVLYLGITRIVMEGGLVFVRGPLVAQSFAVHALGSASISPQGLTALALSYCWQHELKGFFMASVAHGGRLASETRFTRGTVTGAIALSALVALGVSIWYILLLCYQEGAYNFGWWIFRRGATVPYDTMVGKMANPLPTDWGRLLFLGIGSALMGGLTFLRYRFLWWPLNPIGLPVSSTYASQMFFFSFFLGWLARILIVKMGGIGFYNRARPFFIGVILGGFTGMGVSFVIDLIWFPGEGHRLYG